MEGRCDFLRLAFPASFPAGATPPSFAAAGTAQLNVCIRYTLAAALALSLALASAPAMSQTAGPQFSLNQGNLQKRADGVLSLMPPWNGTLIAP